MENFLKQVDGGVIIRTRVTPNAKKDIIECSEIRDDGLCYLKVKTRAIPEDGKANDAIIKIIAKAIGISKSEITIKSGHTSRIKILLVNADFSIIQESLGNFYSCSE